MEYSPKPDKEATEAAQLLSATIWKHYSLGTAIALNSVALTLYAAGSAEWFKANSEKIRLENELATVDRKLKAAAAVFKAMGD